MPAIIDKNLPTQTGIGATEALDVSSLRDFRITLTVVVTGTVTYNVEHSMDGVTWFKHPYLVNANASRVGNYEFPIKFIRLDVEAGTGSADLRVTGI